MAGESTEDSLRRELREELAWSPQKLVALSMVEYFYENLAVRLHPFRCECGDEPRTTLAWGWFTISEMRRLPIPEANLCLLEMLD